MTECKNARWLGGKCFETIGSRALELIRVQTGTRKRQTEREQPLCLVEVEIHTSKLKRVGLNTHQTHTQTHTQTRTHTRVHTHLNTHMWIQGCSVLDSVERSTKDGLWEQSRLRERRVRKDRSDVGLLGSGCSVQGQTYTHRRGACPHLVSFGSTRVTVPCW